jgi:hypothetical protein
MRWIALVLGLVLPASGIAQEAASVDAVPGVPFKQGDVVTFDDLQKLKDYLPGPFWENRDYFFHEGMEMKIGPLFKEYPPAAPYAEATAKHAGQAGLGKDGALEGYLAGQPFASGAIDCKGDPQAGFKIIWNFVKRWEGDGSRSTWSYTYWDRGEQLPLYYEGTAKSIALKERVEPRYLAENEGNIFRNEKRLNVFGIEVEAPFDARGIMLMTYRYKVSDGPLDQAKNDDTWVYLPDLRRVRRISTAQRTDSVQGTDFTFDDLRTFSGIPPQYEWECLAERDIIAPFNTEELAYPYSEDYNFGPYGFSYADDHWELRHAWVIRFDPKNEDHPYHHKDIYIDKDTWEPLYSFAYDRKNELWKIIWHNHRWSEGWKGNDPRAKDGVWYPGWQGVETPSDMRIVSDIIVNVQTGTGNRIEFWDDHGTPLATKGKIRRYIDIGRLNRGR